ncbi:MAG: PadR family transcriptional regulator [Lachnospiraceae bacterium]|nr:PadR family transcriptional regulator [Lachnospiraceae bacterium]
MDKLILGILMLRRLTVYEIRTMIKANFRAMCSDSLGSIQAAVKRLLNADLISYSEYVEKGINKKQYSITEKGRAEIMEWLSKPAIIAASKNMEMGKLLFMGYLPREQQKLIIKDIIKHLEDELSYLLVIKASITEEGKAAIIEYWQTDTDYYGEVIAKSEQIEIFEELTLQHGIDSVKFNIEWFKKMEEKLGE